MDKSEEERPTRGGSSANVCLGSTAASPEGVRKAGAARKLSLLHPPGTSHAHDQLSEACSVSLLIARSHPNELLNDFRLQ